MVLGAIVAFSAAGMSPAAAAGGDILHVPGGQGYATWEWGSEHCNDSGGCLGTAGSLMNPRVVAWDTSCNASGVYTIVTVHPISGSGKVVARVDDACNEIGSEWKTEFWDGEHIKNVKDVEVMTCEDTFGADTCVSRYYDNPET